MHAEILDFLKKAREEAEVPVSLELLRVVEFGAYDLNGSPRELFPGAASYIGIDWRPGKGVNLVSLNHLAPVEQADIVLCCQVLEHDPYWEQTLRKAASLIREGGWLFCTWAGPGYVPHELETAPPWAESHAYYRNLSVEEVADVLREALPSLEIHTSYQRGTLDACLWARK